jgi:hypothetical protein
VIDAHLGERETSRSTVEAPACGTSIYETEGWIIIREPSAI